MDEATSMQERISTAALECMRVHGVRATTTRMIARQAGVSEGSIYNHFTNRSELIANAFAAATQGIRQRAEGLQQLVGTGTVVANLESLGEAIIEFFRELTPILGSIFGDPELRSWLAYDDLRDPAGRQLTPLTGVVEIATYLEQEQARGRLSDGASWSVVAAMLIGACQQYVFLEALAPGGMHDVAPEGMSAPADYVREVVRALVGVR